MFKTALLPVSFREPEWLIHSLGQYLRNFGTQRIVLVHVVASGLQNERRSRERLEKTSRALSAESYEISCLVRTGSPALEICTVARQEAVNFICIPWKRKDFLQRTLLGSTTEDLVRLANLPVFVYKFRAESGSPNELDDILYATSFDPSHERIIEYLRSDKLKAGTLHVLHAGSRAPDPDAERKRLDDVVNEFTDFKKQCERCFDDIELITAVGNPKREILRAARQVDAELIVLGKHGEAKALDKLLGSTAETVTHKSRCSVLIVPAAE